MAQDLQQQVNDLKNELEAVKRVLSMHQHNDQDGTNMLRKNIMLDQDQWISVGCSQQISSQNITGSVNDFYGTSISVGSDTQTEGFTNKSDNLQLNLIHRPNGTISALTCFRKPLASSFQNTSITTTAAGNTVTITGFDFTTNSLAGALIDIFDSSNALVETQTIASNTATVITISGTWINSTSNGTFLIYRPVFLGSTDTIFERLYLQEGSTTGGLRFGVGPTNNTQNGLLYMDATGDLYWRDKAGSSTKLN